MHRSWRSSATSPSSTISTPWWPRPAWVSRPRSCSSTTTAAASSRSCRRRLPRSPAWACRRTSRSSSARRTGLEFGPLVRALGAGHEVVASQAVAGGRGRLAGPTGRPGPGGAHRAASQRRAAPGTAGRGGHGREPGVRRRLRLAAPVRMDDGHDARRPQRRRSSKSRPPVAGRPCWRCTASRARQRTWAPLAAALRDQRRVIAPDLLGHGRSAAPADPARYALERQADDLAALLAALDAVPADVVGYSMGARLALVLALRHPSIVRGLILESPSAGIADAAERARRRAADEALAEQLDREGLALVRGRPGKRSRSSPASRPCPRRARPPARRAPLAMTRAAWPPRCAAPARASWRRCTTGWRPSRCPALVIAGALDPVGSERARLVAAAPARSCPRDRRWRRPHAAPRAARGLPPSWPASAWPLTSQPRAPKGASHAHRVDPVRDYEDIRYEHSGTGIAKITIDRPARPQRLPPGDRDRAHRRLPACPRRRHRSASCS